MNISLLPLKNSLVLHVLVQLHVGKQHKIPGKLSYFNSLQMPIHHLVSLLLQLSLVYPVGRPIPNCKMQYSWYMGSSNRVILAH